MQHDVALKNVTRFQLITTFLAVVDFTFAQPSGQSLIVPASTTLAELASLISAPVTISPIPNTAILDDAAGSHVLVPYTAKVGDVIELTADGSIPSVIVPGENFFTAEVWATKIEPGTEVDTIDQPAAVDNTGVTGTVAVGEENGASGSTGEIGSVDSATVEVNNVSGSALEEDGPAGTTGDATVIDGATGTTGSVAVDGTGVTGTVA